MLARLSHLRRMLAFGRLAAFALAIFAAAPFASAEPADLSRVLKQIDFEERRLGNREDTPMHWTKIEGIGYPHYVNARLSDDRARSGQWSFRFDLNGGSLQYRYDPNQIAVQRGAHYLVETWVQTTVLPHARARITAYFVDRDGNIVPNTTVHSALYAATKPDEDWHKISTELTASTDACTNLCVELELLQPSEYQPSSLGARTLFEQDIYGSAWFDDVAISQVPEIRLSTAKPGNVFGKNEPLRLSVMVNDKFVDDLSAKLVVHNAAGAAVFQRTGILDLAAAQDAGPGQKEVGLLLPDLPPGWYDASLETISRGQSLGSQDIQIVRLADDAQPIPSDPRFGVIATDLPFAGWAQLPDILPLLGVGRVKLAVWSDTVDIQQADSPAFDALLERFADLNITPTACFTAVPPTIADRIGGADWNRLADADPATWQPELAYLVARHANHLDRWQFGDDRQAADFLQKPGARRVYDKLYTEFATLMDKPDLAMPWPAWYDLSGKLPATVALSVPPEVLPSQIPLYIQDIRGHEGHNLSLSLQLLDARYGRDVQIRDLAERVVYALAGGASRIDLPLPFVVRQSGEEFTDQPQELMMVIRTLITQLAGATYEGKLPNASDVDAFLFDRKGQGIVVLWNRGTDSATKQLALNLGDSAERIDLWGNTTPILQANSKNSDTVSLDVGPMPCFLVGVDAVATQMRASVALDKPLLESSFEPHHRRLRFVNPGHITISGSVKLVGPKGWTITPTFLNYSLDPGETFDKDITIEFPYNSFAGPKTIAANFELEAEHNTSFIVPIVVSLGLSDVGMQTVALRDKDDLVVQQMITNYGDKPINYSAFAAYPGQARQERLVTDLGAGKTIIKLYRFANVQIIPNAKVRSGLRELEGTRILNDEVPVQ